MGFFSSKKDDEEAYRTNKGIVGRSFRRGTDKALKAVTFGIFGGSNPIEELGKDAAAEIGTKIIPRSQEDNEEDE